jgi:hypothetical protein
VLGDAEEADRRFPRSIQSLTYDRLRLQKLAQSVNRALRSRDRGSTCSSTSPIQ